MSYPPAPQWQQPQADPRRAFGAPSFGPAGFPPPGPAPAYPRPPLARAGGYPPGHYPPPPPPPKKGAGIGMILGVCSCVTLLMLLSLGACGAFLSSIPSTTYTYSTTTSTAPTTTRPPTITRPPTTPTRPPTTTTKPPTTTPPPPPPTSSFNPPVIVPGPGQPITTAPRSLNNALYGINVPQMGCGVRGPMPDEASFRARIVAAMDCLEMYWTPELARLGVTYVRPQIVHYVGGITTPCGHENWYAHYCGSSDGSSMAIYFNADAYTERNRWDLWVWTTVIHEHNHHLQNLTGAYDGWAEAKTAVGPEAAQRRIELQAQCWQIQETKSSTGLAMSDRDMQNAYEWYGGDPKHGTKANVRVWMMVGWRNPSMGACNTWTADPTYLS